MNESELRLKFNELEFMYADFIEKYDNGMSWTENRIIIFKNKIGAIWNNSAALKEYTAIKLYLHQVSMGVVR